MNTLFLTMTCFLLMGSTALQAQSSENQVKRIRQLYAQAKQKQADNGKNGNAPLDMHILIDDGTQESEDFVLDDITNLDFYFDKEKKRPETDFLDIAKCYLIIENWTSHGHLRYREILLDPDKGCPVFVYMRGETDAGFVVETRYYYDEKGKVVDQKHKVGGSDSTPDGHSWNTAESEYEEALRYIKAFNLLMTSSSGVFPPDPADRSATPKADRIKYIRSAYAEAKQKIELDKQSEELHHHVQVTIHDLGIVDFPPETIEMNYYFDRGRGSEPYSWESSCYFMSYHKTSMRFDIYDEYLFAPNAHNLIFAYSRGLEEGEKREWRYYFDEYGNCIERMSNAEEIGDGQSERTAANDYINIFKLLVQ